LAYVTDLKPIVLAVDDTPSNLDVLNGMLRDDYKVKVALNGPKALELAKQEPQPDVILLDVMMPDMDGYEVCERLKANAETSSIPVIFLTAKTQVEDERRGLTLGAVDYITKPFHPDIVKARLVRHLANQQVTRDLLDENRKLRDNTPRSFTVFDEPGLLTAIESGEGHALEFKSTLRWNLHADRTDKNIENACLKTVAGYLNTDGGVLMVGVTDDGQPIGLRKDGFKSEDKLLLHWVNLLKKSLGAEFMPSIRSTLHTVSGQMILVVECLPSTAPVFMRRDDDESFYVRMTNSTQALKPSEVLAYLASASLTMPLDTSGVAQLRSDGAEADRGLQASGGTVVQESPALAGGTEKSGWLHELQQRHVIRTGLLYGVVAFGVAEVALMVADALEAPGWLGRFLVLGVVAGFPVVLVLSWIYDLRVTKTPSGGVDREG